MKEYKVKVTRKMLRKALREHILLKERGVPPGGGASPTQGSGSPGAGKGRGAGKQSSDPVQGTPPTASPSDQMWAAIDAGKAESGLSNVANKRTDTGASSEHKNVEKLEDIGAKPFKVTFQFADYSDVTLVITHRLKWMPDRYHALAKAGQHLELVKGITDALDFGGQIFGSIGSMWGGGGDWEEIQDVYNVWLFLLLGQAPTEYHADLSGQQVVDFATVNKQMEAIKCAGQAVYFYNKNSGALNFGAAQVLDEYDPATFKKDIKHIYDGYETAATTPLAEEIADLTKDIPKEKTAWNTVSDWVTGLSDAVFGSDDPSNIDESVRRRRKRKSNKRILSEAPPPADSNWTGPAWEDPSKFGTSYEGIGKDYVEYVTEDGTNPRARGSYRHLPGDQLLLWFNDDPAAAISINIQAQTGGKETGGQAALKLAVNTLIEEWGGTGGGRTDLLPWDDMSIWIINETYKAQPEHESRPGGRADPYRYADFVDLLKDRINANYERFRNQFSGKKDDEQQDDNVKKGCPTDADLKGFKEKIDFDLNAGKASKVKQLEEILNAYIAANDLSNAIDGPDSSWGSETNSAFSTVVAHASKNHPTFKTLEKVPWSKLATKWKENARYLPQKGYTNNLTGILAFAMDAYACNDDNADTVIDPSSGGGGGKAAPAGKKDSGSKGGCETEKKSWKDIQIDLTGPIEEMDAAGVKAVKTNLAQLTAQWVANPPHKFNPITKEHNGVFNIGRGGKVQSRTSHDWNLPRAYERVIDKAMKRAIKDAKRASKGVDRVRGSTITITIPCGDYTGMKESKEQSNEQILVEILRKLIRE